MAGYRRDQVMKLLLGIAMKTISNYLNRISPTASDEQFEVETRVRRRDQRMHEYDEIDPSDPGDPRGSARHYLGHGCPKDKAMEQQVFYRTMRVDGLSIFHREAGPKDTLSGRCLSFNRH